MELFVFPDHCFSFYNVELTMGIKSNKPTSPGRRFQTHSTFEELTTDKPEKSLLRVLRKKGRQKREWPFDGQASGWWT